MTNNIFSSTMNIDLHIKSRNTLVVAELFETFYM